MSKITKVARGRGKPEKSSRRPIEAAGVGELSQSERLLILQARSMGNIPDITRSLRECVEIDIRPKSADTVASPRAEESDPYSDMTAVLTNLQDWSCYCEDFSDFESQIGVVARACSKAGPDVVKAAGDFMELIGAEITFARRAVDPKA